MILQNDIRFKEQFIIDKGCAFMCIAREANRFKNIPLDPAILENHFRQMKAEGCFTKDTDPDKDMLIIWVKAFEHYGMKVLYQKEENGSDFCFYNWYNPRTKLFHFTCGQKTVVTYDPLGFSITANEGYIHSTRGFKILK